MVVCGLGFSVGCRVGGKSFSIIEIRDVGLGVRS
jgi:hypothetical protein